MASTMMASLVFLQKFLRMSNHHQAHLRNTDQIIPCLKLVLCPLSIVSDHRYARNPVNIDIANSPKRDRHCFSRRRKWKCIDSSLRLTPSKSTRSIILPNPNRMNFFSCCSCCCRAVAPSFSYSLVRSLVQSNARASTRLVSVPFVSSSSSYPILLLMLMITLE